MTNESSPRSVQVLRGNPDEVDLAALTAVLAAYQGGESAAQSAPVAASPAPRPARSAWAARARELRSPLHPGPGAWRWSAS